MFHLSNATGKITCDEVFDFAQEDLEDDDIMMLDTWSQLFLWIGENANREEKEQATVYHLDSKFGIFLSYWVSL